MSDQQYMERVCAMERKLYRIAYAILFSDADCADAIQETVFRGWMKKAGLRQEAYLETWLVRILINVCRSMLRRKRTLPLPEHLPEPARDELTGLMLRDALRALPEKYRMPLLLHHLEGFSLREIAQMLDLSEQKVKYRMHQGRIALKKILKAGDEIYEQND